MMVFVQNRMTESMRVSDQVGINGWLWQCVSVGVVCQHTCKYMLYVQRARLQSVHKMLR